MLGSTVLTFFVATSTVVETIEVVGFRSEHGLPDPSASQRRIDRRRLDRAAREGTELTQLIDSVAGARVYDLGGPVAEKKLSVRGGGFDETLVIVDGVPLSSPFATGGDVDLFAPDALESVELVRGGAGASYGEGALSGALVLSTRKKSRVPTGALSLTYGDFETVRASGSAAASIGALTASFERTRGDFPYTSSLVALPDREEIRDNSDASKGAASLYTGARFGETSLSLALGGGIREGGVPGLETQERLFAREAKKSGHAKATISHRLEDGSRFTFGAGGSLLDIDYRDEEEGVVERSSARFHSALADAALLLTASKRDRVRVHVSLGGEGSRSSIHGDPSRSRFSAAISDEHVFEDLSLFGALRLDKVGGQELAVLPRAGLLVRATEELSVRLGLGRSFRAPAIDELYHPPEAGFSGNPQLRAETAWEAEAGASWAPHPVLEISGAVFGRLVWDGILYLNQNAFLVRPENFGRARAAGGELELSLEDHVFGLLDASLELAGTAFFSRLAESTGPIPARPPWGFAASGSVAAPSFYGLGASLALRTLGETWANLAATQPIDLYARLDATIFIEPAAGTALALSVTNLLDDRTLESVHKLPLPGRAAFFTLRIASEGG